jgi:hypothetical protein
MNNLNPLPAYKVHQPDDVPQAMEPASAPYRQSVNLPWKRQSKCIRHSIDDVTAFLLGSGKGTSIYFGAGELLLG